MTVPVESNSTKLFTKERSCTLSNLSFGNRERTREKQVKKKITRVFIVQNRIETGLHCGVHI